ncbi:DUF397 domain-containing protein [Streptomyces sp. NPDC057136]|uniref:DUF397 domain-containing protein n=1 Tax=Streptomyces sp. NPDC057136 TaxID=3346029 RepID=UPI003630E19E
MSTEQSANGAVDSAWFKSSYSGTNGGDCVEVAVAPDAVRVRDSKRGTGPALQVGAGVWATFVSFASSRDGSGC